MEIVKKPKIIVRYNTRDVTEDLSPFIEGVDYVDKTEGESDTITLKVADSDGRFLNAWHPEKGDSIELFFGYEGDLVPAGVFEIDQIEVSIPPLRVSLMAMAAPVSKSIRTKRSFAHEDSSLAKIAERIAEQNGLTVSGEIDSNIVIPRATQSRETDLAFLYRLAKSYGYGFNVRGTEMIFYSYYNLEASTPKTSIDITEVTSAAFKDKTTQVYKSARLRYHNPDDQELVQFTDSQNSEDTEDELEIYDTAKTPAIAESKARAALYKANKDKTTGSLVMPGNTSVLAGNNITLTGVGVFSGLWHVVSSRHSITPGGGFSTSAEIKKVG